MEKKHMYHTRNNQLVKGIFRSNLGFTAALAVFYVLQAALTMWAFMLPSSVRGTIERFADEYKMPQAYIFTDITPEAFGQKMEEITGIESVDARFVIDGPMTMPEGNVLTPRFIRTSDSSFQRMYVYERLAASSLRPYSDMPKIKCTRSFASANGLSVGSVLEIKGREAVLCEIVTCPDGMFFYRNETSWYDHTDFALIFIDQKDFDGLFGTAGCANQFLLRFDAAADAQSTLDAAAELLGESVISSYLYEGSDAQKTMYENLDTVTLIAYALPVLIIVVSVLFSWLFIYQVISKMSRMIGLMRAAGCRFGEVLRVFLSYIGIIAVPSSLAGMAAGMGLVVYTTEVYEWIYSLPQIYYSGDILLLILIPFFTVLSGMISCLICSGSIARIKPAEAYSENSAVAKQNRSKLLERVNLNVYVKIALGSVLRNQKRFLMSIACITACFCILLVGTCFMFSKDIAVGLTFDVRYRYDCMVYFTSAQSEDEMLKAIAETDCAETVEPVYVFFEDIAFGEKKMRVQINGISSESTMIFPPDIAGKPLPIPSDGIILEEYTAKELGVQAGDMITVSGQDVRVLSIARELVNTIQYCSYEQAKALVGDFTNAAAVNISDGVNRKDFSQSISRMNGYSHTVFLANQQRDMMNDMRSFDIPAIIVMSFAVAAGMIMICNMFAISINEKRREYALMIIQGVSRSKLFLIALTESAAQYLASCAIGCTVGPFVAKKMLEIMSMGGQKFPMVHLGVSLLIASGITLIYITIGSLLTQRMVKNIDLPAVINGSGK